MHGRAACKGCPELLLAITFTIIYILFCAGKHGSVFLKDKHGLIDVHFA